MPILRREMTHTFHRVLYGGQTERIRLHKRDDDQRQGTIATHVLYDVRRSAINKTGQTLDGDMNVGHTTRWHIPRAELDRVGINYLNPIDKVEQLDGVEAGNFWQPESDTQIDVKLFANMVVLDCKMLKPKISRVGVPGY